MTDQAGEGPRMITFEEAAARGDFIQLERRPPETAGTFYLLICRECGNGDLVMPFGSPAERGKWAAAHTTGTGHDRWFVTESTGRLTGEQVTEMLAAHDRAVREIKGRES